MCRHPEFEATGNLKTFSTLITCYSAHVSYFAKVTHCPTISCKYLISPSIVLQRIMSPSADSWPSMFQALDESKTKPHYKLKALLSVTPLIQTITRGESWAPTEADVSVMPCKRPWNKRASSSNFHGSFFDIDAVFCSGLYPRLKTKEFSWTGCIINRADTEVGYREHLSKRQQQSRV